MNRFPTPTGGTQPGWSAKAGRVLFALVVAGSALAVGSVHTRTLCVEAVVLAIAVVLVWLRSERAPVRPAATLLLWTAVALTAWTAIQCIPLPSGWLDLVAHHNADVWARALMPLREGGPTWTPISLDPSATRVEALKGVLYVATFVTALRIARRKDGVTFLSAVIIATGLALAVAAVLHPALGAKKLFGWYEPEQQIADRHIAPLLNANHLAAYLNIAFCLALGMTLSSNSRVPRPLTALAVVLLGATQIWVASRGGVVAMLAGAIIVVAIARTERLDPRRSTVWVSMVSGAAVLVGALVVVLRGSEDAQFELLDTDTSKVKLFAQIARMLPVYGLVGTGRGAFESTFPPFRTDVQHLTYTNPENVVLQWMTEWGLPLGLLGLVAIAIALRPTAVLARSRVAAGAWAGLVAVVVHNLCDFSSEIPGVMLACVVCAAIVTGGAPGRDGRWRLEQWAKWPSVVAVSTVLATIASLVAVVPVLGHELRDDRFGLRDACVTRTDPVASVHDLARAAMLRHPGEAYLPFSVALRAVRARDDRPMPWLEATLERAPVYGPAHLLLARLLAPAVPSQARLEYRVALEQAPPLIEVVKREAPHLVDGYDDATELVPAGPIGVTMLKALIDAVAERLPATRARLQADLARRSPLLPGPASSAAKDVIDDLEAGDAAPWCTGDHRAECTRRGLDLALEIQRMTPAKCDGQVLEARLYAATGDQKEALRRLWLAAAASADRAACLRALVEVAMAGGDGAEADRALDEMARTPCADDRECAAKLRWVGKKQEERGHPGIAAVTMGRAHKAAPWDDVLLVDCARLASVAGMHAESLADYQLLARHQPSNAVWPRRVSEETTALARSL